MNVARWIATICFVTIVIGAKAHPGVGIVMDSKGNVFYTDLTHIWKIDAQGKKTIAVNNVHSHEIYIDSLDNLFGEHLWYNGETKDTWSYYVWKLTATGKLEKIIPSTEASLSNYSFVRDHKGHMFWADRSNTDCEKVARKNPDGTILKMGDQCLENIRWMTSAANGTVYLIDQQALKKVDQRGHIVALATNLAEKKLSQVFVNEDHYLGGLSVDNKENIYVADYSGRMVKKVTPQGRVSVLAETNIPWSPSGTLAAPNGDFWILEYSVTNSVRVEKITNDGRRIIY